MPVFQYLRDFLDGLSTSDYSLEVTESKHYWVLKDDSEAIEDLTRAYLEGETYSLEFEPLNDSGDYQAVVDEAQNMVVTNLRELNEVTGIGDSSSLKLNEAATEYLKYQIIDQINVIEDAGSYKLVLDPERKDEMDLLRGPAFS